jgi:hypothetical protein
MFVTSWILISNNADYDLDGLFEDRQHIYWQQKRNKFSTGDIVCMQHGPLEPY